MSAVHTVREWESLQIGDGSNMITRVAADRLCLVAQRAQQALRLGGDDGGRVLENHVSKIRAQQVVGVLAAPGATLEILPKIDGLETRDGATRANLVRMLAKTRDLPISDGLLTDLGTQHHDLLEILIRLFVEKLFPAVHRGLPRRYVGCEEDLPSLRGSLNVIRQFTILAATPNKLASRFDELSSNIVLNQLMKATVVRLRNVAKSVNNQRRLAELALAFADVEDISPGDPRLGHVLLDRTNTEWHELVRLARLLLQSDFQTTSRGQVRGYSLLFEMNVLFEEFIGRTLQQLLRGPGQGVTLQGPQRYVLAESKTGTKRFRTRPDIVIHHGGQPRVIIDTKWKRLKGEIEDPRRGVGQADVYQMLAYGETYGVDELVLLYPHHSELGSNPGVLGNFEVFGAATRTLTIATVSLEDLKGVPAQLGTLLSAHVRSSLSAAAA